MSAAPADRAAAGKAVRLAWIGVLAFGSGLPFGLFHRFVPIWLRQEGVGVEAIGALSLLAWPWTGKVLWAPVVDRFGRRKVWIAGSLVVAALGVAGMSWWGGGSLRLVWLLLGLVIVASATQDIAVDAYTIGLIRRGEEGPANGARVTLYRVAMVAGGGAVALASIIAWDAVLLVVALVLAVWAGLALLAPRAGGDAPAPGWAEMLRGLAHWIDAPGVVPLTALVLVYKLPDSALGPMTRTFWQDAGLPEEAMGAFAVPEVLATLVGAWMGAWIVARTGILRGLLWCGLAQALSNLVYGAVAITGGGTVAILGAAVSEALTGGLGTTAFLALLMRVCEKERAAVEYALLSALFALPRDLVAAGSGYGVAAAGYAGWFGATTLLALPGLVLLTSRQLARRVAERPLGASGHSK
jgi:PAT family beta-lactamase induction signal transducer AmpG